MTTETKTPEKASFIIDTSGDIPILRDGFGCRPANPSELELWHLAKRVGELEGELSRYKWHVSGHPMPKGPHGQTMPSCEICDNDAVYSQFADLQADRDRLTAELAAAQADSRRVDKIEEMGRRGEPLAEHIDPINDASAKQHGVRVLVLCLPYLATERPKTIREAIDRLYDGPTDAPLPTPPEA